LELLSEEEIERIHSTSIEVLENIGVAIENENAIKILADAGAKINPGKRRVYIPEELVNEALKHVPSEVRLSGLYGKQEIILAAKNVYFNPGSTALYMLDRESMRMRRPSSNDFIEFVRLAETLEYIHAQSTAMVINDVPDSLVDRFRLYLILKHSVKPIVAGAFTAKGVLDMKHMLELTEGEAESSEEKQRLLMDVCPSPPLKWSNITSQNLIDCAKLNIPIEIIPAPQLGSTGPATLAGLLVQHNAEFLSGLVIAQFVNAGIPLVYSGSPSIMDMRYGTGCVGNIEVPMLAAAYAQISRSYNIPSGAYLGISETKTIDAQTGLESAIGLIIGTLANINCITGPGMLGFENCQSLEKLVIDNEICGMALRMKKAITVNRETLAYDLMKRIGPGGHFLAEKHTLKWFQSEGHFCSPVIDKISKSKWESSGAKNALTRSREHVNKILSENHRKPLPADIEKDLDSFMSEFLKHET